MNEKEEKMRRKLWICLALVLVVPGLLLTTSCAKKVVGGAGTEAGGSGADSGSGAASGSGSTITDSAIDEAKRAFEYEDVYFAFDSAALDAAAQSLLSRKAAWMDENPSAVVLIEGHCDERGTAEYNIALGERRAEAAKAYLVNLGIADARLKTVSYGEEKPVDEGHNEEAWAKNRRAHFVVE
jgi:peptidoglycan-associated lipoprotein